MNARVYRSVDSIAREYTEDAMHIVASIMVAPDCEPQDRLRAANMILDRGHGKPLAATITLPASKAQRARLAAMSDEDLIAEIQGTALPRLARDPLPAEAEYEPVHPALQTHEPAGAAAADEFPVAGAIDSDLAELLS